MKCKLNILNQNREEMLNLISVSPTVIMLFHVFKKIVRLKLVDKKKDNILFIEPTSPSCNSHFSLDTDGFINPRGFKTEKKSIVFKLQSTC